MTGADLLYEGDGMRIRQCRHGRFLYAPHDTYVGRSLDLYGEFSEGEGDIFRGVLKPGMVAIDVGANIGCHTVLMASLVGPSGTVIGVEPQRHVFHQLAANMALNDLDNVRLVHAAAGATAGAAAVPKLDYGRSENFGAVAAEGLSAGGELPEGSESVPRIPLDQLGLPGCHLLKIDVEGAEAEVVDGAAGLIKASQPVIYAENDRPDRSAALVGRLLELGYRAFWHTPTLYNPDNFAGNTENVFGGTVSLNILALPAHLADAARGLKEVTSAEDWPWTMRHDAG